jgi:hypothetical protein
MKSSQDQLFEPTLCPSGYKSNSMESSQDQLFEPTLCPSGYKVTHLGCKYPVFNNPKVQSEIWNTPIHEAEASRAIF